MSKRACMYCKAAIPRERARFLAESGRPVVCVKCTSETARLVLMDYGHKTAGYAVVVSRGDEQKAWRAYRRAR
jgi:hypothetical protein